MILFSFSVINGTEDHSPADNTVRIPLDRLLPEVTSTEIPMDTVKPRQRDHNPPSTHREQNLDLKYFKCSMQESFRVCFLASQRICVIIPFDELTPRVAKVIPYDASRLDFTALEQAFMDKRCMKERTYESVKLHKE